MLNFTNERVEPLLPAQTPRFSLKQHRWAVDPAMWVVVVAELFLAVCPLLSFRFPVKSVSWLLTWVRRGQNYSLSTNTQYTMIICCGSSTTGVGSFFRWRRRTSASASAWSNLQVSIRVEMKLSLKDKSELPDSATCWVLRLVFGREAFP